MIYHLAADFFLVFHFLFIVFVLFGGLFTLRFRWAPAIHIPAATWGAFVEITGRICPLTTIEVWFQHAAGDAGYSDSFIEHYLYPIIYPNGLDRDLQLGLAGIVILLNAAIYGWVIHRHRKLKRK
ncbi:MAG: DUF2784 domain-containing protein [Gammaproteobacteria bacterium]|nr:DUF2784 domain-containing protein [Gammaproteobacteria bacterium]MCZ6716514.1 DUF2784 domain-containing protein [Gammaproteobacteria bacterium]MCZ6827056.1 DUF2784 domain-containing protein [Gammaproteobacteria bacterium]